MEKQRSLKSGDVQYKYDASADHRVTARVVRETRLPVIANGDILTAADGRRVLAETGVAGLMLGRGAELGRYLREMMKRFGRVFCGDTQVLHKLKEMIAYLDDPEGARPLRALKRTKCLREFEVALNGLV